ncbi:unnamed protein product [Kuraishia capsulata CBS 1993]|uniref:Cytosolic endo-beta-N-acetylglucosaminidase TIM barrel domain-containing protein n=1 Tax=Kuraishia capsulata CBS 1993 TaxID=1382522 RepID=W6MY58_9ASCO|nr:uncharacterized protein KUCA_T00006055001 [Kuraishia capsulata CBS 1993]CDK30060.1 unnamed protein product [Kuraishia capsulata CBS 1993]
MVTQSCGRLEGARFEESGESRHQAVKAPGKHEDHVAPLVNDPLISFSSNDVLKGISFDTLTELEKWATETPTPLQKVVEAFNTTRFSVDLFSRGSHSSDDKVKLLVCHDFKGGYQTNEDLSPQGYFPHLQNGNRYFLQFPELCDLFVYFSHHCITIPPLCWVDMCHRFAIPCYGTVAFEGKEKKGFGRLDRLMARDNHGEFVFVKALVKLVRMFKLDGLLLNFEAKFSDPKLAKDLVPWLAKLRGDMRSCNGAKVIWYDAYVGSKNQVQYVNGVNHLNYEYFDLTDGFLTNYWWSENELEANLSNVGKLGLSKTFVGYDVWGRGLIPGLGRKGGFNTGKDIAIIKDSSVGLFAPAWTYEFLGYENFKENDAAFWKGISETVKPDNVSVRVIGDGGFIFHTNFNQGTGSSFYVLGERVFDDFWANGGLQNQIPETILEDQTNSALKVELDGTDSFTGGNCLKVSHDVFGKDIFSSRSFPTKLLNWRTDMPKTLFSLNQNCHSSNVKVCCTFQPCQPASKSSFQLQLCYQILRRHKVYSSGKLIFPLHGISGEWVTVEKHFISPRRSEKETLKLTVLEISHVDSDISPLPYVEDTSNDKDEWVVIPTAHPRKVEEDMELSISDDGFVNGSNFALEEIKIGEISVVATLDNQAALRCSKVAGLKHLKLKDSVILSWTHESGFKDDHCDFWCVYVNDIFQGATTVSQFAVDAGEWNQRNIVGSGSEAAKLKVRIDTLSLTGELQIGANYYFNCNG